MANLEKDRGQWNSKLGFILAASGSAVGLGNIWGFPTQVASNGGAAFLLIYLLCCFLIGFPLIAAELTIGRHTQRNPVGAFRALKPDTPMYALIGLWGIFCGTMILSYYNLIAGWTLSYVFEEAAYFTGFQEAAAYLGDTNSGLKNVLFSVLFMGGTVWVVRNGISGGIEKTAKVMMPLLIIIMLVLIGYVLSLDGSQEGLREYLVPDFSEINAALAMDALGQAFFSLSLGMGALITYGSYMSKEQNIPESAAYITAADFSIAFIAGLILMPAMYIAQANGIGIFDGSGALLNADTLVFTVFPELFHSLGGILGFSMSLLFFSLLTIAALTSTISLLEVPVSFLIDQFHIPRQRAALIMGGGIALLSAIISYNLNLIGVLANIFNNVGLPLGGLMICLFLGYVWKVQGALGEMEDGYSGVKESWFAKVWPPFIRFICPVMIAAVFVFTILSLVGS